MAASIGLSAIPGLYAWQVLVVLSPAALLLISLAWTKPYPEFKDSDGPDCPPIEDLSNPSRKVIWLNGPWEFKLAGQKRTRRIDIPRPWNSIPGLENYNGQAIYRRLIKLPEGWSQGTVFLRFRGVNYRAVVSIDGKQVGSHEGGFTSFEIDVTDRLSDRLEHELEVAVDNRLSQTTVPNVVCWNNDGGIIREVYLETRNPIHIDDAYLLTIPDLKGRADIALMLKIHNPKLEPRGVRIEVYSPQGALVHEHEIEDWTMQTLQHRISINFASLWSPENPSLYRCRVMIMEQNGDERTFTFGVRSIEAEDGALLLNGKPLRIRGVSYVPETEETGVTMSLADFKRDLEAIKAAGFNTVRFAHLPPHAKVLDLCDKMGLLVIEEIPVWNALVIDFSDPGYQQAAETQLKEALLRDRNRACILAWGLASSIESGSDEARWFVERLAGLARGLDDHLVYIATSDPEHESCADLVDFIALDIETRKREKIAIKIEAAASFGTPVVMFHQGDPAYRPADSRIAGAPGTEEHQAIFLRDFILEHDANQKIAGWAVSALADYRDPSNFAGPTPFARRNGLLDSNRKRKIAFGAISGLLNNGELPEIQVSRSRMPIASFAKILAVVWAAAALAYLILSPHHYFNLAYNPEGFVKGHPFAWQVILFTSVFTALNFAILFYRFFRSAPRKLLGSINMPFLRIIAFLLHTEINLFIWAYLTIIWFWVFDTTLLSFFFHKVGPAELLALTAALSLPESIFFLSAFFRINLIPVFIAYNVWKVYLCYTILGLTGTIMFVLVGPAIVTIAALIVIEMKFHVLKYIRLML